MLEIIKHKCESFISYLYYQDYEVGLVADPKVESMNFILFVTES